MNCIQCGNELTGDARFCSSCGSQITQDGEVESGASKEISKSGVVGGLVMLAVAGWLGFSGISNMFGAFGSSSEFSGAEQIVKNNLKAPSSYQFQSGSVLWSGVDQHGNEAHIVQLEYDAQNGFGANIRNCQIVSYIRKDGNLEWSPKFGLESCETGFLSKADMVELLKETNFGLQAADAASSL